MLGRARTTIRQRGLAPPGSHLLVAVSGGADSVALLAVLRELRADLDLRLTVAHLDHGLRGAAGRADADFVRALAASWSLPCICGRSDVRGYARRHGLSIEMAARNRRYAFFARTARRVGADRVATAHTADDDVETFILNLARGSGPAGLAGIPVRAERDGLVVVRPLLDVDRAAVERFLRARKLDWREDESNRSPEFLRNRVRHQVLPMLETELNAGLRRSLRRTMDVLGEEEAWVDGLARERFELCRRPDAPAELSCAAVRSLPLAARRRVLTLWLREGAGSAVEIDFDLLRRLDGLVAGRAGSRRVSLVGGRVAVREYDALRLESAEVDLAPDFFVELAVPGISEPPGSGVSVRTWLAAGIHRSRPKGIGVLPSRASITPPRADQPPLVLRAWQRGDRIRPLGLRGSVKVHDLFVDQKVPRRRRSRIPLVACGSEIVWIPGYRIARDWRVASDEGECLQIEIVPAG